MGCSALCRLGLIVFGFLLAEFHLSGQSSLAANVLVVYEADNPDSQAVSEYYVNRRGIPASNFCPIHLPSSWATTLNAWEYEAYLKQPIQSCLKTVGAQNILYIVLAYLRPFSISTDSGLGYYALDSYLADLWDQLGTQNSAPYPPKDQPYYAETQNQGNVYIPFQSLAAYRADPSRPLIYSVWRLDGATPSAAIGLVDKAIAAESSGGPASLYPGVSANACVDMVVDPSAYNDSSYRLADWDLLRTSQLLTAVNRYNVILDGNVEVLGDAPASDCRNTAFYVGWYNYGRYNDAFSWLPGSIGWDLDSGALADPRGGVWWGSNALQHGVTVTSGPVAEPYLEGLTRPNGTIFNLLAGANVGDAFLRNTRWLKWMILNVGDPLYTPFPQGLPPINLAVPVNALSLSPREAVGGHSEIAAFLTLSEPAPPEGLAVSLWSDNPALPVPPSINVAGGNSRVDFQLHSNLVPQYSEARITAWLPSGTVSNTQLLYPWLADLQFSLDTVAGGQVVTATVSLNEAAPTEGVNVQLSIDQPGLAEVPTSVFVPAGSLQTSFQIVTAPVETETKLQITASLEGAEVISALTLVPSGALRGSVARNITTANYPSGSNRLSPLRKNRHRINNYRNQQPQNYVKQ